MSDCLITHVAQTTKLHTKKKLLKSPKRNYLKCEYEFRIDAKYFIVILRGSFVLMAAGEWP